MEMNDHQNPWPTPFMNWRGKFSGFALESYEHSEKAINTRLLWLTQVNLLYF